MTQQSLLALAERCEQASGPNRELDAAIAYQHLGYWTKNEGHPLGRQCYDTHGIAVQLPRYTASLDAAMTLVPEGARLVALTEASRVEGCATIWFAKLGDAFRPGGLPATQSATPALALTAAALRAHATILDTEEGR